MLLTLALGSLPPLGPQLPPGGARTAAPTRIRAAPAPSPAGTCCGFTSGGDRALLRGARERGGERRGLTGARGRRARWWVTVRSQSSARERREVPPLRQPAARSRRQLPAAPPAPSAPCVPRPVVPARRRSRRGSRRRPSPMPRAGAKRAPFRQRRAPARTSGVDAGLDAERLLAAPAGQRKESALPAAADGCPGSGPLHLRAPVSP